MFIRPQVTSEHKIILVLEGNARINPASSSKFEPISLGILFSVPVSYVIGYLLYDNVIFRKLLCWNCL